MVWLICLVRFVCCLLRILSRVCEVKVCISMWLVVLCISVGMLVLW